MAWVRKCLIIPDDIKETCVQIADSFGSFTQNMWITPLSETGLLPATHWISTGSISEAFSAMLESPENLVAGAALLGVTIDLATAQSLLQQADISLDDPFIALDRLNLKLIFPEE